VSEWVSECVSGLVGEWVSEGVLVFVYLLLLSVAGSGGAGSGIPPVAYPELYTHIRFPLFPVFYFPLALSQVLEALEVVYHLWCILNRASQVRSPFFVFHSFCICYFALSQVLEALEVVYHLVCAQPHELEDVAAELARSLVYLQPPSLAVEGEEGAGGGAAPEGPCGTPCAPPCRPCTCSLRNCFQPRLTSGSGSWCLDVLSVSTQYCTVQYSTLQYSTVLCCARAH